MQTVPVGILLVVVSGFLQGALLLPMRLARGWKWENTWLVFAASGYFLLPWVFAALTVPSLGQVYAGPRVHSAILVVVFGLGFGVAALLFGLACDALGMALGFTLILGLGTAVGSIIPLIVLGRERIFQAEGIQIMVGVLIMVAGVFICGWAGKLREDALQGHSGRDWSEKGASFSRGLLFALLSGLLNPLINIALVIGSDLSKAAVALGAKPQFAPNVLWTLVGTAAFVPNALYCSYLLRVNKTAQLFTDAKDKARNFVLAFLMGLLWIGTFVLYGTATVLLGALGPSVGWPIFMALLIISSSLWGLVLGEWRAGGKPLKTMYAGLVVLVCSVLVIGLR